MVETLPISHMRICDGHGADLKGDVVQGMCSICRKEGPVMVLSFQLPPARDKFIKIVNEVSEYTPTYSDGKLILTKTFSVPSHMVPEIIERLESGYDNIETE